MREEIEPEPGDSPGPSPVNQSGPPPGDGMGGELPDNPGPWDEEVSESPDLDAWKDELRDDFDRWLDEVDEIPDPAEAGLEDPGAPDLRSFYEQLAAAGAEARKANRRTTEAFSQWSETLGRFEAGLAPLRESVVELKGAVAREPGLSNGYCLAWIEMLDRMRRLAGAFDKTPARTWWGGDAAWREAWEAQRQGFNILIGHLESLLKKEGVERLATAGQPFDPARMAAVAVREDPSLPHHTVLEEVLAGYSRRGELLRPAQVKVTVNQSKA